MIAVFAITAVLSDEASPDAPVHKAQSSSGDASVHKAPPSGDSAVHKPAPSGDSSVHRPAPTGDSSSASDNHRGRPIRNSFANFFRRGSDRSGNQQN